MQSIKQSEACN